MDDPSSFETFGNISQAGFNSFGDFASILILLCLLISSALISGSEAAFFSLTPVDKEDLKADSGKSAKTVTELLKKPKELLATILIANCGI